MTHISKYQISEELEKEMFTIFWSSIPQLKTSSEASTFFADLLSDTEEKMLAKRFIVALLLEEGKKPVEIADILHVSFSTIHTVSEWVSRAHPSTKKILENTIKTQAISGFFDKVDELIDALPPRWGTNWHTAGKEKWKRKILRRERQKLR